VRTSAHRGLKRLARQLGVGSEVDTGVTDEASRTLVESKRTTTTAEMNIDGHSGPM
jgi:hypothetical protein